MTDWGAHAKLDHLAEVIEAHHAQVLERLGHIEAALERRDDDDDEPRDTLSDEYAPHHGGGGSRVFDEDTQSVFRRLWDPVAQRWIYEPEP